MRRIIMAAAAAAVLCTASVSCTSVKTGLGTVGSILIGDDYTKAGYTAGRACYTAYAYLKNDPEYDEYTSRCEQVYLEAVKTGKCDVTVVSAVALQLCREALEKKYGTLEAQLIVSGIRIAGGVADNVIAGRLDMEDATRFTAGFMNGIADCLGTVTVNGITSPIEEAEAVAGGAWPLSAENGSCHVTGLETDCTIVFQESVVDRLLACCGDGDVKTDEITPYENLVRLKERLQELKEAGRRNTRIRVSAFTVKDGRLQDILLLCSLDGGDAVCRCVGCRTVAEELRLAD